MDISEKPKESKRKQKKAKEKETNMVKYKHLNTCKLVIPDETDTRARATTT